MKINKENLTRVLSLALILSPFAYGFFVWSKSGDDVVNPDAVTAPTGFPLTQKLDFVEKEPVPSTIDLSVTPTLAPLETKTP